jgi:RAT1-interacting protein
MEGVWRIRRQERSPIIEIFRMEETGYGDILSDEFLDWRLGLSVTSNGTVVESTGS